ncbi:hypothetical protein CRENBAI_008659 [Crenichthys baileyi]|uniref:Uncharacterized protein n=1 Tax=Crenichthys baileyi TaxID=28760 RepID=A0AAV9QVQ3_9TELE
MVLIQCPGLPVFPPKLSDAEPSHLAPKMEGDVAVYSPSLILSVLVCERPECPGARHAVINGGHLLESCEFSAACGIIVGALSKPVIPPILLVSPCQLEGFVGVVAAAEE